MNPLDVLLAIEEIRKLKARYCRMVDTKDWAGFERLFTPDAVLNIPEARSSSIPLAEFIASLRTNYASCVTIHHAHTAEIDIVAPDRATAVWAMDDQRYFAPDDTGGPASALIGAGHYHEAYVRRAGTWSITELRLTRLRLQTVSHPRAVQ